MQPFSNHSSISHGYFSTTPPECTPSWILNSPLIPALISCLRYLHPGVFNLVRKGLLSKQAEATPDTEMIKQVGVTPTFWNNNLHPHYLVRYKFAHFDIYKRHELGTRCKAMPFAKPLEEVLSCGLRDWSLCMTLVCFCVFFPSWISLCSGDLITYVPTLACVLWPRYISSNLLHMNSPHSWVYYSTLYFSYLLFSDGYSLFEMAKCMLMSSPVAG